MHQKSLNIKLFALFLAIAIVLPSVVFSADITPAGSCLPLLKGVRLDNADPFKVEFIFEKNKGVIPSEAQAKEAIRYFLAALTIPEQDLWVNLSPNEPERVIDRDFSSTPMGELFLHQDYLLKQLAAGLTDPRTDLGASYWHDNPDASSNRVWIISKDALVIEGKDGATIDHARLVVEMEQENKAFKNNILPVLEQKVNNGSEFASLRQAYNAFILAYWFKHKLRESIFQYYADNKKLSGIDMADKDIREKVYNAYLESFKKGVYDYVANANGGYTFSGKVIKRHYFSGGIRVDGSGIKFTQGQTESGPAVTARFTPHATDLRGNGSYKHIFAPYGNDQTSRRGAYIDRSKDLHDQYNKGVQSIKGFAPFILITDKDIPLIGEDPAYHFYDDDDNLIIVLRHDIYEDIAKRNEAIEHECLENDMLTNDGRMVSLGSKAPRIAHMVATMRYIVKHFDGKNILPIHAQELAILFGSRRQELLREDRSLQAYIRKRFFNASEVEKIEEYEVLFRKSVALGHRTINLESEKYNGGTDVPFTKERLMLSDVFFAITHSRRVLRDAQSPDGLTIFGVRRFKDFRVRRLMERIQGHYRGHMLENVLSEAIRKISDDVFEKGNNVDLSNISAEGIVRYLVEQKVFSDRILESIERSGKDPASYNYKLMGVDNPVTLSAAFIDDYIGYVRDPLNVKNIEHMVLNYDDGHCSAMVVEDSEDKPIPGDVPAVSFDIDGKLLIIVSRHLKRDKSPEDRLSEYEEAVSHEAREKVAADNIRGMIPDVSEAELKRFAHVVATARMVERYGAKNILPLHRRNIAKMGIRDVSDLLIEDRSAIYDWVGQYFPALLVPLTQYEDKIIRPALDARLEAADGESSAAVVKEQPTTSSSGAFRIVRLEDAVTSEAAADEERLLMGNIAALDNKSAEVNKVSERIRYVAPILANARVALAQITGKTGGVNDIHERMIASSSVSQLHSLLTDDRREQHDVVGMYAAKLFNKYEDPFALYMRYELVVVKRMLEVYGQKTHQSFDLAPESIAYVAISMPAAAPGKDDVYDIDGLVALLRDNSEENSVIAVSPSKRDQTVLEFLRQRHISFNAVADTLDDVGLNLSLHGYDSTQLAQILIALKAISHSANGGVVINASGITIDGKRDTLKLSSIDLDALKNASGMDFSIEAIRP